jgi:ATP-dependent protease ClpP protease subunit
VNNSTGPHVLVAGDLYLVNSVTLSTELLMAAYQREQTDITLLFCGGGDTEGAIVLIDCIRQVQQQGMKVHARATGLVRGGAVLAMQACSPYRGMTRYAQLMLPQFISEQKPPEHKLGRFGREIEEVEEEGIMLVERTKFIVQLFRELLPQQLHEYHFPNVWVEKPMPAFFTAQQAVAAGLLDFVVSTGGSFGQSSTADVSGKDTRDVVAA